MIAFLASVFFGLIGGFVIGIQMATWGVEYTRNALMVKIAAALRPSEPRAKQNGIAENVSSAKRANLHEKPWPSE